MPPLGKMSEFDPKTQNFESYLERFEHFLTANDIVDAKRLAVFLTVIGPEAYEVLRSLVVPAAPGEKSYAEVKRLLKEHYSPRSSVIAERCKFNRRVQQEGESVEGFIVELKHLVRKCDYGGFLQDALRDRLVAGIRNEETQRALFAERELTFDGACKIALDRELAARDTEQLRSREREAPVLVVKSRPHQYRRPANPKHVEARKNEKCARCGRGHSSEECWYKNFICRKCSAVGHLKSMCPVARAKPKNMHALECSDDDSEQELYHVINANQSSYEVSVEIEGRKLNMQIDTGAAVTIVPEQVYLSEFPHVKCEPCKMSLRTYTGEQMQLKGQCDVVVKYNNQCMTLPVIVVKNNGRKSPVLMGRNWLERLKLDWLEIGQIAVEDRVAVLKQKYPSVFSKKLGTIQKFEAKIVLKPGAGPVFCRARPVPFALQERVERQLREHVETGMLRPVMRSDWATPLVTVVKENGSVRLCGDYKTTVNPSLKTDHYPLPRPEDLYTALAGGKVFSVLDLSSAYQQLPLAPESRPFLTVLEREASGKQQTVQENIDSFLMAYRNTPSSVTSKSPAELFLRRQPRIKLSLLQPDFAKSMRDKQEKLKEQRDLFRGQERSFVVGDRVLVKTVRGERVSWEEGVVIQIVSAVTYMVKVRDQLRFTHADHLRPGHADPGETPPHAEVGVKQTTPEGLPADDRTPTPRQPQADQDGPSSPGTPADPDRRTTLEHDESVPPPTQQPVPQDLAESHVPAAPAAPNSEEQPPLRRGARVRRQPDWFRSEDFK
ncbi:uncharacterized protein [Dermacentor andersoni]|uniref:uncharacterized protein n=1 Tax=Dermacentor andersoni TaxID=34620 RepID=UPI003B3A642C